MPNHQLKINKKATDCKPKETKPRRRIFLLVWVSRIPFLSPCSFRIKVNYKRPTFLPGFGHPFPKGRKSTSSLSPYVCHAGFPLKMVQRKVPNKLRIQADHVKSDKLLANLKPSSSQYQDGKNRGADMKKKMKKSRSIKLSDIESLRSSPTRKDMQQPGKPPPLGVPASRAIAQKQQPLIKASDGSPNYMKSTSCFDARKEQSQVSIRNTQTGSESKNVSKRSPRDSKHSSASGNKPARALTRTSSLKLVRTLTKTPSFKPARASAKKSSRAVLCADMNAQRGTCSSTLKDSKFPPYLMLSPGATESEGTSAMKVCPYTYCSLNGHRHSPLPPLKCFLSARRRLLKTQKSMKTEALSPRRAKPSSVELEDIVTKTLFDDKSAHKEADFGNFATPPLVQDAGIDFFVEIYARSKDYDGEPIGEGTHGPKAEIIDVAGDVRGQSDAVSSIDTTDEGLPKQSDKEQGAERLFHGSAQSEVDFEENLEQYCDISESEMDTTESLPEEQVKDRDEGFPHSMAQDKTTVGSCGSGSEFEEEWAESIEADEIGSEASDMEWEVDLSASELDSEADYLIETGGESVVYVGDSLDKKNPDFWNEYIGRSDDVDSCRSEVILVDEVLQELFAQEGAASAAQSDYGDSALDGVDQYSGTNESCRASENLQCDQLSSTEDGFEESKSAEEENGQSETKLISNEIPSASMEEQIVESKAAGEDLQENNRVTEAENLTPEIGLQPIGEETNCTSNAEEVTRYDLNHETLLDDGDGTEEREQTDDAKMLLEIQPSGFFCWYSEADQLGTEAEDNEIHKMTLACQPDETAEDCNSCEEIDDDGFTDETQDNQSNGQSESSSVVKDTIMAKEEVEAKHYKISTSMDDETQNNLRMNKCNSAEESKEDVMEVEDDTKSGAAEMSTIAECLVSPETERPAFTAGSNSTQELPGSCNSQKWTTRRKRHMNDEEELRKFNPREPNYLPLIPDPESEKVDLRHQMEDERKNSEEWMLDYHLQQAVTKLAPARKRKVALLVEAFETVMPTSKCEASSRSSPDFVPARPMQACG